MVARVTTTLEDAVSVAMYDMAFAGLSGDQRAAAAYVVDRLQDWFEDNWRDWLEAEDGSLPIELTAEETAASEAAGYEEAIDTVRRAWKASGPVARGTLQQLAEEMKRYRARRWS